MTKEQTTVKTEALAQGPASARALSGAKKFAAPPGALTGPLRVLSILLVSVYLGLVAMWLIATGKIDASPLKTTVKKLIKARFRPPYEKSLSTIRTDSGFCWRARVKASLLSDLDGRSALQVFEDGRPLGPAHALHHDIRAIGLGRYSHWGRSVYFSTSDNSNPQTNGRRYAVREVRR